MTDFTLVDPKGWEYDLHSVYSAYIGYFQVHNIPWFERTWGHLFTSFEDFLAFSWPSITVTDAYTGRAHIVTRLNSIGAFLKMIKTRFGETLPQAPNILQVTPFETSARHLRNISDYATYKRMYSTLPAAVLAAQRVRVRAGDSKTIKELWAKRDKTYLALSFVWSERNEKSCLEFGYAAVRCAHMEASGHWPPIPDTNYRKGHYIVEEYVDKVINKHPPNQPWQYAFGESQMTPKSKLPQIVQAVISLTSPESETSSNSIVLVGYGTHAQLARLEEMKIKLPHNVLTIDIANFERSLYATGVRGVIPDPKTERPRTPSSTLTLESLLRTFQHQPHPPIQPRRSSASPNNSSSGGSNNRSPPSPLGPNFPQISLPITIPQCSLVNSGNDAFMALFAFQMLLDPSGTRVPTTKKGKSSSNQGNTMTNLNAMQAMNMMGPMAMGKSMPGMPVGLQGMPPIPMYGVPMMPGVPGMPMVAVNGGMGPMPVPPPGSPMLLPSLNNKNSSLRVRADSGSGKIQRPTSGYDLSGEFGQMGMSMKRVPSSGLLSGGPVGGGLRPASAGTQPQVNGAGGGLDGGVPGSLKERKSSFLDLEKRQRRNSALLR
ncbi:hypothetical protein NP233_g5640 [Leucocoprinus birnbaumii]|uniref:Gfd2/YDR514C-like C-terminal domain-containing protein n=1 Tax=Leucocoprinus birnbaumii TaxID=56174 RepID=A0AAD5VV49_9AGAR|nr:hypothetical protein NP233_g5640 [Leucocoprinus birnbaumii]